MQSSRMMVAALALALAGAGPLAAEEQISGAPDAGSASADAMDAPLRGTPEATSLPAPLAPDDAPAARITSASEGVVQGRIALALSDAIAIGVQRNLNVEVERHTPLIAHEDHLVAWGSFDPSIGADLAYRGDESPIASSLQNSSILVEREILGNASLSGMIPLWGAEYSLGYTGRSLETTSSIASLSPEYRTVIFATFNAPVLKNFLWSEPWTQVRLTRTGYQQSVESFRQTLMDAVRGITDAYWSVAAGRQSLRVAHKSLEASNALLRQTEAQYEVGVVSRVEVFEAEAGVAEREVNLIRVDATLRGAQDQLVDLVFGTALSPNLEVEVIPIDSADAFQVYDVERQVATDKAMTNRPELAIARKNIESKEISRKFAWNQRLPQLDLEVKYGFTGLSGKENTDRVNFGGAGGDAQVNVINAHTEILNTGVPEAAEIPLLPTTDPDANQPLNIDRRYSGADDDFFGADGAHQFTAKGIFSIPLFNVSARHRLTKADIELRKARTELRRTEQGIVLEIRDAVRNLEAALRGIAAAQRRSDAAQEQFRAEGIRLEQGESTPFEVLQRERDLVDAESQRINALQVYHNSVTALDRAQGTILKSRNIVLDDARGLQ